MTFASVCRHPLCRALKHSRPLNRKPPTHYRFAELPLPQSTDPLSVSVDLPSLHISRQGREPHGCALVDEPVGYLQLRAAANGASMHMCARMHFRACSQFQYVPRSGIAASHNSLFSLPRNHPADFHSSGTFLHSHRQCIRAPVPHVLTHTS